MAEVHAHTGVEHEQLENGIWCHQTTYIKALQPLATTTLRGKDEDAVVEDELAGRFASLLGGVAWTVLTRTEVAIYVQALQRHASVPRVKDLAGT